MTFAWNTDPDAPSEFLDTVEFLRQNGDDWTAGVIDFAGDSPSITAPASCQTCHGSLNKPLWSGWSDWEGTEYVYPEDKQYASVVAYMRGLLESSDQRIEQLDFSASRFYSGNYAERFLKSPGRSIYVAAVVEAGAVWSWRHAEVLFSRLKDRYTDFPQYAEQLMCGSTSNALYTLSSQFDQRDHNLSVLATIDDGDITPEGLLDRASAYVSNTYHYQTDGSIADAVNFLTLFELWERDPIVRKLYRETSNEDTVHPENAWLMDVYLHYGPGKATAEDELIQKFRLHFGQGVRAAMDARAAQNESMLLGFVPSASFWDGHLEAMRPRVCKALRNSEPENLRAALDGVDIVLDWDAPTYDANSITGYRILRGTGDEELSVLVASTDTKDTAWTDEDPAEGDYVYAVQTVYDDYYHSSESDQVRQTVAARPNTAATGKPPISGTAQVGETLTADTSGIADSDGLNNIPYSYQWVRSDNSTDTDISDATGSTYTLVSADEGKTIKVKVSFTDEQGNAESLTSDPTATVAAKPNSVATGAPTISGTAQVGETLTADTSGISDADGTDNVSYNHQWVRSDGADDTDISDATASTYTLVSADEGKTIKVKVSFTDDEGNSETLTSATTAAVAPPPNTDTLTASLNSAPKQHDGASTFNVRVLFSEDIDTAASNLPGAFTAENATLGAASKVDERSDLWEIEVTPTGDADVTLTLAADQDCEGDHAPCTADDRQLGNTLTVTVPGSGSLVGFFDNAPISHDGENDFEVWVRFDRPITASSKKFPQAFETENGSVKTTNRMERRSDFWVLSVEPTGVENVTLTLLGNRPCGEGGVPCAKTSDGEGRIPLSNSPTITIPGPNLIMVSDASAEAGPGATMTFTISLGRLTLTALTVDYRTVDGTATAGTDYTGVSGTLRFAIGEQSKTVTVQVLENGGEEEDETFTLQLSDASVGYINSGKATGTITSPESTSNTPATGRPSVTGTAQVGETLTADTTGIGDADGLNNVSYSYQWVRSDGTTDTDITGATTSTYTLVSADQGNTVKVRVSFTDDAGNAETLTSASTASVAAVSVDPPSKPTGLAASTTSSSVTLTWDDPGDGSISGYQILRFNRAIHSLGDFQIHVDDTSSNEIAYTDTDVVAEARYVYRIKARNSAGLSPKSRFANADLPEAPPEVANRPATGTPTISGTAQVGETLTVDSSGISDADGLNNVSYTYQWVRNDGTGDSDIAGATGSTYTLVSTDQGKTVKVKVSFTDDAGNAEEVTSRATVAVAAKPNTAATGSPAISGTAQVGETLTADTTGIEDADGLDNVSYSYQWVRNDGAADTDVANATGSTYTLADDDQDKTIKVRVSFTDDADNAEELTSASTASVLARPNTPATGTPTISGTAQVGETLTADTSGITDADGLDNVSFSYQWARSDGTSDSDITGATGSKYTLASPDEGNTVKVRVNFTDDTGNAEEATSAATDSVEAATGDIPVWSTTMTTAQSYTGQGYSGFDGFRVGSLTETSFEIDDVTYTVNLVEALGWVYIGLDKEMPIAFTLDVDETRFQSGDASFTSYTYSKIYKWDDAQINWSEGDSVQLRLYRSSENSE